MKFIKTEIPEVYIIEPSVFGDSRGYFLESFNLEKFEENVCKIKFVQDNESKSSKGVLRGLHFQKPPFNQAKLVRCLEGRVMDVAVDVRKDSPTYGKHVAVELTGENKKQLFVPRGFAHGYSVLEDHTVFVYKCDNFYQPKSEGGIIYNDEKLNINWMLSEKEIAISEKDKVLKTFNELEI